MILSDETRDLQELEADIASRLTAVCAHFPPSEFEALVRQIARVELKYARRMASTPIDAA